MRMMSWMALVAWTVGCTQMDATGNVTSPLPPAETPDEDVPAAAPVPASGGAGEAEDAAGFDFEEDVQPDDGVVEAVGEPDAEAEPVLEDAPTPAPVGEPIPLGEPIAEPVPDDAPVYAWDPDTAPPATWGIRLLSTVNSTLPPRAVIGLPDGTEQVVQPGAMLPEQSVIVMAVGKDVIEIAQVVPDGVQARVETQTITSLFPQ